jgi:hypothetical protein
MAHSVRSTSTARYVPCFLNTRLSEVTLGFPPHSMIGIIVGANMCADVTAGVEFNTPIHTISAYSLT